MTKKQRNEAYQKKLKEILSRADVLDARAMADVNKLVELLMEHINGRISREVLKSDMSSNWGLWWLPQLMSAVNQAIADLGDKAGLALSDGLKNAWENSAQMIDATTKISRNVVTTQPIIDTRTLTILAPYSADLVTGVAGAARETMSKTIAMSIALGRSPVELMKDLHEPILARGTPANKVAYHAERIVRTELARVHDMSAQARLQQVSQEFPDLMYGANGLKEIFVCVQRGPYPCPTCRPLHGKLFEIGDPNRPVLPIHPNCRCRLAPFFVGVNTPPEPILVQQDKRSVSSSSTSKRYQKLNKMAAKESSCC